MGKRVHHMDREIFLTVHKVLPNHIPGIKNLLSFVLPRMGNFSKVLAALRVGTLTNRIRNLIDTLHVLIYHFNRYYF